MFRLVGPTFQGHVVWEGGSAGAKQAASRAVRDSYPSILVAKVILGKLLNN